MASKPDSRTCNRREFLHGSLTCAGHLTLASLTLPVWWRSGWAQQTQGRVVAQEAFGRLEQVADGVWALISTPLGGDRTTVANGGLVAGRTGVLAIEGFFQPQGAAWLAARSRELTGRSPTDVLLTHYHADHVNGLAGYLTGGPRPALITTATTRDLALVRNQPADPERSAALNRVTTLRDEEDTTIDLGGRTVRIVRGTGHTPSDLAVVLDDPAITFCGDLVWNGMFPNYVDAVPSALARAVRALRRGPGVTYVPGHGAVASDADVGRYIEMLDAVEDAARRAHGAGTTAKEAAAGFSLPPSLGDWTLFGTTFFERAFAAWYRELDA
jgi:glyoxylase-like metal-dependent hydrolase (beta-lactamase superfamily II)